MFGQSGKAGISVKQGALVAGANQIWRTQKKMISVILSTVDVICMNRLDQIYN